MREDERNFLRPRSSAWADPSWRSRLCPAEPGRRKPCFLWSHPRGGTGGYVGSQFIVAQVTFCFLYRRITTLIILELRGEGNEGKVFSLNKQWRWLKSRLWLNKGTWCSQPWSQDPGSLSALPSMTKGQWAPCSALCQKQAGTKKKKVWFWKLLLYSSNKTIHMLGRGPREGRHLGTIVSCRKKTLTL